jgi:Cu2+-exporting ATPase
VTLWSPEQSPPTTPSGSGVTAVGDDTALAGIQRLVAEAQASSSKAQALADRAAAFLFYFATGAGVITFIAWTLLGSVPDAVTRTVTVLVIACPHALGLAIPLVIAISTEQAARAGVLIKNRMALERMRTIDVVLFDKTGTLTKGEPELKDVATVDGSPGRTAGPGRRRGIRQRTPRGPRHRPGRPPAEPGPFHGQRLYLHDRPGRPRPVDGRRSRWAARRCCANSELTEPDVPGSDHPGVDGPRRGRAARRGRDRILGAVSLEDAVREESRQAVGALQNRGVKVAMITGDARQVARPWHRS